jgi:hypothetical protein
MNKENENGFLKEVGKWSIAGGIVAGIIGLLANSEWFIASLALVGGGWILHRD